MRLGHLTSTALGACPFPGVRDIGGGDDRPRRGNFVGASFSSRDKALGSGTLELIEDFDGDTYRAVYTVRFSEAVYVLHAFKKKSKRGGKTPQTDIDLIRRRLQAAEQDHAARFRKDSKR